ncbi:hypothetical protein EAG_00652 [Camponotus floridanus]|uniref:Uncharacterized protein n=1 Tax=Camponotus floridanus TaxID=104421 RepID=E2A7K6_CAMFO|nr:hypothetical protein EAG_00652 [Camponotus floridanus]
MWLLCWSKVEGCGGSKGWDGGLASPSPDARSFDHYSATHVVGSPMRLRHFVGVFADDVSLPQHSPKGTCLMDSPAQQVLATVNQRS